MVTGTQLLPGRKDSDHGGGFTGEVREADSARWHVAGLLCPPMGRSWLKVTAQRTLWRTDQKDTPTVQGTYTPLPWLCDARVPDIGFNITFPKELELDLSVCLPDRESPAQPKALEARALTRQASAKATVGRETSQKRKIEPLVRKR